MSQSSPRVFSREFKLMVVRRMLAGENVSALSRELEVRRKDLYLWRDHFRAGGPDGLRGRGRPRKAETPVRAAATGKTKAPPEPKAAELDTARERIAGLERKIGQQQVELDFFRQALRQVKGARRPSDGFGVTGSTRSSKR
jgi:transposase